MKPTTQTKEKELKTITLTEREKASVKEYMTLIKNTEDAAKQNVALANNHLSNYVKGLLDAREVDINNINFEFDEELNLIEQKKN